ncbi:MAG: class I SAM-dependent methyltransferase [bacterium]
MNSTKFNKNTQKNYDGWYGTREGIYIDEKEKETLISMLRLKENEKVLEVGAGTGRYVKYLNDIGVDACGIEYTKENVKNAILRCPEISEKMLEGDAGALPYADNSFETVLFMISFEYIKDHERALREALRVAKTQVGIGFLNKFGVSNILRRIQGKKNKEAKFFSAADIYKITKKATGEKKDIKVRHTLYLPVGFGHLLPFVDEALEKFNLPFGSFAVAVIKK